MGTNYYWHANVCDHCGRSDAPMHIGKSSAGWCFALHVIPEDGINDLDDWRKLWDRGGGVIQDEYGQITSPTDMLRTITERQWPHPRENWHVGFSSEQQFHEMNHSEPGPNGLLRHRVGRYCLAHGAGTWDCCPGEFS